MGRYKSEDGFLFWGSRGCMGAALAVDEVEGDAGKLEGGGEVWR